MSKKSTWFGREKWHICEKPGRGGSPRINAQLRLRSFAFFLCFRTFKQFETKGTSFDGWTCFPGRSEWGSKASSLRSWSHPNLVLRAEIGKVLESWICHGYDYEPAAPGEASMGHQSYNGNTIMLSPMNNGAVTIPLSNIFCMRTYVKENMGIEHNYSKKHGHQLLRTRVPRNHAFLDGIFHENRPLGIALWLRKPPVSALRRKSSMCSVGRDRASAERSLGGCGVVFRNGDPQNGSKWMVFDGTKTSTSGTAQGGGGSFKTGNL